MKVIFFFFFPKNFLLLDSICFYNLIGVYEQWHTVKIREQLCIDHNFSAAWGEVPGYQPRQKPVPVSDPPWFPAGKASSHRQTCWWGLWRTEGPCGVSSMAWALPVNLSACLKLSVFICSCVAPKFSCQSGSKGCSASLLWDYHAYDW